MPPDEYEMIPIVHPKAIGWEEDQPILECTDMCQRWQCVEWRGEKGKEVAYAPKLTIVPTSFNPNKHVRKCPRCGCEAGLV